VQPEVVIREVVRELAEGSEGLQVRIQPMPLIQVDPIKLEQVYLNLVGNALKFSGDEPVLEMGRRVAGEEDGFATLFVRDNGPGIEPGREEEIFEPFKRFSYSGPKSMGIGLSTVKRAVEGWGGRVWAESSTGGSTFYFTAPM